MKPATYIFAAAWLLSLAAAFLIGSGSRSSEESADGATGNPSSSRGSTLSGKSDRSPSSRGTKSNSGDRGSSATGLAGEILRTRSAREAVVELAQLNDPIERAKGFLALIDGISSPDEFLGVVADFRALGMTEERMSEYGMLLHAWGKADPEGALAYAMEETRTPYARQTILASWAADNPEAAIAFAKANYEGKEANPLLVGVIRGIAPTNLNRATDLLQDLPYSRERGTALQTLLPFVMQEGVDSALSWTDGIADERLKSGAITYIMADLSESNPEAAAERLLTLEDAGAALRVADDVAGSLARADLNLAISWAEELQPDLRSEAVEGIISSYASQDSQAASQWLESLSGSINLDSAITSFAWTTRRDEPELAANWIGRVEDERRRNELYNNVVGRWYASDAEAAENWINTNPELPESVRLLPERMRERQARDAQRAQGRTQ